MVINSYKTPNISIVFAAHREGALLARTLESLRRSLKVASEAGFSWEVVVVLDKGDGATRNILNDSKLVTQLIEANFGDPSLSRNLAVCNSQGRWICIMDADNLVSSQWIRIAAELLRDNPKKSWVLHPELEIDFGESPYLRRNVEQSSPEFDVTVLAHSNYWDLISIAPREAFLEAPFPRRDVRKSVGYEDWYWHCETIARGWVHRIAPGTVHFRRLKQGDSIDRENTDFSLTMPQSGLWAKIAAGTMRSQLASKAVLAGERKLARIALHGSDWIQAEIAKAAADEPELRRLKGRDLTTLQDQTPSAETRVPFFAELCAAMRDARTVVFLGSADLIDESSARYFLKTADAPVAVVILDSVPRLYSWKRLLGILGPEFRLFCFADGLADFPIHSCIQILLRALLESSPNLVISEQSPIGRGLVLSYRKILGDRGIRTTLREARGKLRRIRACPLTGVPAMIDNRNGGGARIRKIYLALMPGNIDWPSRYIEIEGLQHFNFRLVCRSCFS